MNQFRLFLSQAAYLLMLTIREAAQGTRLPQAQVTRLRSTLIKTAAKVSVSVRRVLVQYLSFNNYSFFGEVRGKGKGQGGKVLF